MVVDYNTKMSGIDRADQIISYYPLPRKSMRWYVKVFFHILDICLWNGNHLYNSNVKKMSHLEFRRKVASELIGHTAHTPGPSTPITSTNIHVVKKVEIRKRCRVCHAKKIRKNTQFVCDTCIDNKGKTIGLCPDPCFKIFHS
uniref:PiggyBac transposable element-derived protein 4 n=1 Tax=Sipha flava TaxID=143950 RepID=A0A2S2R867_9HEMI